ncbi:MAG: response regulator [Myxococcales bacterium]|nr:response regulator [Myxococcales bacterium]
MTEASTARKSVPAYGDAPLILVVDDEVVIREILADFLAMEGFNVRTAEDGQAALMELSRARYDLVLSDLKMPNMGGIELLEAISEHAPNVVTIIMTGFGTVETAIGAMKRGAYDYIMKPFKMEEVVHTVRRGLERKKLVQENLRLRETLSLYKVSEAIANSLSLDSVVRTIVDAALDEVEADAVFVLLDSGEGEFFERARVISDRFHPPTEAFHAGTLCIEALGEHFRSESRLVSHGDGALRYFDPVPKGAAVTSLMVTRLMMTARTIGYLGACSFSPGKSFDEGQRKLLRMVSDRAAASIENAKLYEDLKATFRQTIRGLASAIDKMDRYTAGHSSRVAAYAQVLAIKLGLPEDQIEIVRQSALMHDIGKIGCALNLNKPGILTEAEYATFQKHPGYGRDILEPIEFLNPLIPGVHCHHEHWDGHGYPLGLKGKDIPLMARIISVADVYDAMTSDRAYRKALPHEAAVAEIDRCAGGQFDPDVAAEFTEVIEVERQRRRDGGQSVPP